MEIFFTDHHQLTALAPDEHGLVDALREAAVPDRMPFILASDGSYNLQLNRFLRELPHNGARSWHSKNQIITDLQTTVTLLAQQIQALTLENEQLRTNASKSVSNITELPRR